MEPILSSWLLLPIGLGLLGFIEPCTIGAHLIYLRSQGSLSGSERLRSLVVFIVARSFVTGVFGALMALLGEMLVTIQTSLWMVFGLMYLVVASYLLTGRPRIGSSRFKLAPERWKGTQNPILLGLAFGLNVPACAAPILFGLLGFAGSLDSVAVGFWMMFLFGMALSSPFVLLLLFPRLISLLESMPGRTASARVLAGIVFVVLGFWSIWFSVSVNPADWTIR